MRTVKLGLVGCGTVGSGVVKIINKHRADFLEHLGVDIELCRVTSRTRSKLEALGFSDEQIVSDYHDIIDDPDIDIVIELIGGTGVAADVIIDALRAGKNVVTANKAVMASRGKEVFEACETHHKQIAFEGAVGGGIPIIAPLKRSLTGNEISSVLGILNGTTNYMLTRMSQAGLDYDTALKEAQDKGFAEADPTADVDGYDAAAKIAILASIAFNSRVTIDDVPAEGIRTITPTDFRYADHIGYALKLISIAHKSERGIDIRVHPTMIPKSHPLASVNGVYNAIFVHGDAVGDVMFFGEGAGSGAAASAVMGDVIEIARDITHDVDPIVGCTCTDELPILDMGELQTQYYLRIKVADQTGVLAQISKVFGDEDVSIRSMMQQPSEDGFAQIIFVTHKANEAHVRAALDIISSLDCVKEIGTIIRIEDN